MTEQTEKQRRKENRDGLRAKLQRRYEAFHKAQREAKDLAFEIEEIEAELRELREEL